MTVAPGAPPWGARLACEDRRDAGLVRAPRWYYCSTDGAGKRPPAVSASPTLWPQMGNEGVSLGWEGNKQEKVHSCRTIQWEGAVDPGTADRESDLG